MKRILKYVLIMIGLLAFWMAMVFLGTKKGWWHDPIAKGQNADDFIEAVQEKFDAQFVGNFAMAMVNNGTITDEIFYTAGKPVDRNTVFQVASLSKWVSAFGVMKLVEEGKLDLDVPVSRYLTRWELPQGDFNNNGVTVRRLLSHTAGLTDGLGYSGFEPGVPVQSIEASLTKALDADEGLEGVVSVGMEPGEAFAYSGGGYTLLQLIVEEVSGQPFPTFMKEAVFKPLGMVHSSYIWEDSSAYSLAEFYNSDGTEAIHYRYTSLAATSLYTSLSDMEIFFKVFLEGNKNEPVGRNVLRPEMMQLMREVHAKKMGMDIWGLGTILYAPTGNGDFIIGHDGKSTPAINTAVRLDPQSGNGIIVLETGHPLMATILASEWVFWSTGKVDITLFAQFKDKMLDTIVKGGLILVLLTLGTGLARSSFVMRIFRRSKKSS
jgi:CubicO group peptidase (beta-lactamase class C family)